MSSVKTQSRYDASRHLSYISTAPYNTFFWTYTYTGPKAVNSFNGTGALSQVLNRSGNPVSTTDCPAGRILRTNGKKLHLDAAAVPAVGQWVDRTTLIGVIDYSSGLSGFIDPNQSVFSLYNVDSPVDGFFEENSLLVNRNTHKGMSIYTAGDVTADGNITAVGNMSADGNIVSGGQVILNKTTSVITYAATDSPYAFGTVLSPFYSFAAAAAVNLNATSVPPTGTTFTIFYSGAFTTTPNTGFVGATVAPTGTQCIAVSYVSNGSGLVEYARSGALPSVPAFP